MTDVRAEIRCSELPRERRIRLNYDADDLGVGTRYEW